MMKRYAIYDMDKGKYIYYENWIINWVDKIPESLIYLSEILHIYTHFLPKESLSIKILEAERAYDKIKIVNSVTLTEFIESVTFEDRVEQYKEGWTLPKEWITQELELAAKIL